MPRIDDVSFPLQVQILNKKVDVSKVMSKCGSKDNIKHKPGRSFSPPLPRFPPLVCTDLLFNQVEVIWRWTLKLNLKLVPWTMWDQAMDRPMGTRSERRHPEQKLWVCWVTVLLLLHATRWSRSISLCVDVGVGVCLSVSRKLKWKKSHPLLPEMPWQQDQEVLARRTVWRRWWQLLLGETDWRSPLA